MLVLPLWRDRNILSFYIRQIFAAHSGKGKGAKNCGINMRQRNKSRFLDGLHLCEHSTRIWICSIISLTAVAVTRWRRQTSKGRACAPDLCLPVARGKYHGLYIELKAGKNKPTEKQKEWLKNLEKQGHKTAVAYSYEAAADIILNYLEEVWYAIYNKRGHNFNPHWLSGKRHEKNDGAFTFGRVPICFGRFITWLSGSMGNRLFTL